MQHTQFIPLQFNFPTSNGTVSAEAFGRFGSSEKLLGLSEHILQHFFRPPQPPKSHTLDLLPSTIIIQTLDTTENLSIAYPLRSYLTLLCDRILHTPIISLDTLSFGYQSRNFDLRLYSSPATSDLSHSRRKVEMSPTNQPKQCLHRSSHSLNFLYNRQTSLSDSANRPRIRHHRRAIPNHLTSTHSTHQGRPDLRTFPGSQQFRYPRRYTPAYAENLEYMTFLLRIPEQNLSSLARNLEDISKHYRRSRVSLKYH